MGMDTTVGRSRGRDEDGKAVGKGAKWCSKVVRSEKWSWEGQKKVQDMRITIVAMHGQLRRVCKWKDMRRSDRKRSKMKEARALESLGQVLRRDLTFTFGTRYAVPNVHFGKQAKAARDRRKQGQEHIASTNHAGPCENTCRSIDR